MAKKQTAVTNIQPLSHLIGRPRTKTAHPGVLSVQKAISAKK